MGLKLYIDKKRYQTISENSNQSAYDKSSIYDKLYSDFKTRTTRMNQTIKKYKDKELSSLSNDSDSRERFFVPKINEKSRRITTKKFLNNSGTRSVQNILYKYAMQKRKVKELNENFQINESKQIAEAKIRK